MQNDGVTLDGNDERAIWRKLLLSGIFQKLHGHYWVVDGLDECSNVSYFFSTILAKLDKSIPLRILVTSRDTLEIQKSFCSLGVNTFRSEAVSVADTLPDIKALVEAKANSLIVKDKDERAVLVDKILKNSQGSFLWTVLVLNELSDSYTEQEISQVLEDVPRGMESLYQRSLEQMSQATRGKKLSKAVLTWTICTTRPLTIGELHGDLKLDIKDNVPNLQESILALCGHMVTVDNFGRVQVLHETVREFLLRSDLESEFAIIKEDAHTRIARACLTYLTGDEMKPPRTARRGNTDPAVATRTEFFTYACTEFSYHISKASPFANDVLLLVEKFLKSNILSWIEVIARSKDLAPLVRTAKNLKVYLDSCTSQRSPLGQEIQTMKGWTTDLVRIAAKFADALLISPSAIHSLILPFCPRDSAVYKTASRGRRFSVIGLSASQWDDRLACIKFHGGQTTAICYSDDFFAVGLSSGTVAIYHATSCQEYRSLNHGEGVKFLQISSNLNMIASSGLKAIRVWDIRCG
ncbi:hypothetical protein EIK77_003514 [Talaromyces pinophilus]|nr:hypothetical protein EIK77_003514 [Talaromyces pinophilus]